MVKTKESNSRKKIIKCKFDCKCKCKFVNGRHKAHDGRHMTHDMCDPDDINFPFNLEQNILRSLVNLFQVCGFSYTLQLKVL